MTPIGSTSSNIRRAIEFIACSSCCRPRAPRGHSRSPGRLRAAKLIAQRRLTVHLKVAVTMAPGKADVHAMVTALFTLTAGMERARRKRKAAGTLSLLQLVAGRQPIRPSEIAEVHDVHPSLVTRQVRELEDAGLVQVAADPTVTARAACGSRKCRTAPRMTQTGWLGLMTARRSWLPRTASHPPGNGHTPQARYPCHGQLWDTTSPSRIHRDPGGRPVPRRGSTGKPEPPFRVLRSPR